MSWAESTLWEMRPDSPNGGHPEFTRAAERFAYFRGVLYGFQVGREHGFGEGVQAVHRAISKILRERRRDAG